MDPYPATTPSLSQRSIYAPTVTSNPPTDSSRLSEGESSTYGGHAYTRLSQNPGPASKAPGEEEEMEVSLDPPSTPLSGPTVSMRAGSDDESETSVKKDDKEYLDTAMKVMGAGAFVLGAGAVIAIVGIAVAAPLATPILLGVGIASIVAGGIMFPVALDQLTAKQQEEDGVRSDYMMRFDSTRPSYLHAKNADNKEMSLDTLATTAGKDPSQTLKDLDESSRSLESGGVNDYLLDNCPFNEIGECRNGNWSPSDVRAKIKDLNPEDFKNLLRDKVEHDRTRSDSQKDSILNSIENLTDEQAEQLQTYWKNFMILVAAYKQKPPVESEFFVAKEE